MRIFRLFYIIYIALRFSLDEFILSHTRLKPLQVVINGVFFWRNKDQSRGARLRLALEALGPIFVKFGQMLSTRRDLIPLDISDELAKLQDQVPPFAYTEVEKTVQLAYDLPLNQVTRRQRAMKESRASHAGEVQCVLRLNASYVEPGRASSRQAVARRAERVAAA